MFTCQLLKDIRAHAALSRKIDVGVSVLGLLENIETVREFSGYTQIGACILCKTCLLDLNLETYDIKTRRKVYLVVKVTLCTDDILTETGFIMFLIDIQIPCVLQLRVVIDRV